MFSRLRSSLASAALIDIDEVDPAIGGLLHGVREQGHGDAVIGIGGRDMHRQHLSSVSTTARRFEPWVRLCPAHAARSLLSGVERSVRLSTTTAKGSSAPPAAKRNTAHRSPSKLSKEPARS